MKADPFVLLKLLDLQVLDSTLHRLTVRRSALPALAAITALRGQLETVAEELVGHQTQIADSGRAASRLENDIEQVRARSARDQQRLDTGQVSTPRELENLQSEIASLHRRQTALEDDELEILEVREQAETARAQAMAVQTELLEQLADAEAARDRDLIEIDANAQHATADRVALAPTLPTDLLALYDRIRANAGGVGAAALLRRRCEGCHLELAENDLSEVRAAAADEVLRHEDCGRILVRTADSGL